MYELISIVIPIYNVEQYLRRCINSVIDQTYSNLEIILVDDGSTDSCSDICDDYIKIDSRIVVIHKKNGGLSDARNEGMKYSTGKYLYFLDSDDYLEPNALEMLYGFAERENAEIVNFEACIENDREEILDERYYVKQNVYTGIFNGSRYFEQQFWSGEYRSPVQYYFYRRDYLEKHDLTFHVGVLHEDEEFTIRALLKAQRVILVPCVLYHHTVRNDSIMGMKKTQKNIDSLYEIIIKMLLSRKEYMDSKEMIDAYICAIKHLIQSFVACCYNSSAILSTKSKKNIYSIILNANGDNSFARLFLIECVFENWSNSHPFVNRIIRYITKIKTTIVFPINILIHPLGDCSKCILELHKSRKETNRVVILCVHHNHGNRGDLAISLSQREFLDRHITNKIIEVPTIICERYYRIIVRLINTNDILMVSGGGWFGSLWRHNEIAAQNVLNKFVNNRIIVFPQTVFYSDDNQGYEQMKSDRDFFSRFNDLYVFVRDMDSYQFVTQNNVFGSRGNIIYSPDIVMTYNAQINVERDNIIAICLRKDIEQALDFRKYNEIVITALKTNNKIKFISNNMDNKPVRMSDRDKAVIEQLEEIKKCKMIITDRLHSMIFAAITSTPCVVFNNKTGKVKGVYSWLHELPYITYLDELDDLDIVMDNVCNNKSSWEQWRYEDNFKIICELITEHKS